MARIEFFLQNNMGNEWKTSDEGRVEMSEKKHPHDILEWTNKEALEGESFEDAASALDAVDELQAFRKKLKSQPFGTFYDLFEDLTVLDRTSFSRAEKDELKERILGGMEQRVSRFSPRVADLYLALIAEIRGDGYQPKFEEIGKKIAELRENQDIEVLISGSTSWEIKLNRIEQRLNEVLKGWRALDKREGNVMDDDERRERAEKLKNVPTHPPSRRNESKPSMDEMNRLKEGECAPALWSIQPAYGGYFREQSFSTWNSDRNVWSENAYEYRDISYVPAVEKENPKKGIMNVTMHTSVIGGSWVNVPIPYTHGVNAIETGGNTYRVSQDQNGDIMLFVEGEGEIEVRVILAYTVDKKYGPVDVKKIKHPEMQAQFSGETRGVLEHIRKNKKTTIERAEALASFTRRTLEYSNESVYNETYDNHPQGYFAAIEQYKKADCDVGNTYFAALCAALKIPVRHCVGHSVKGKDSSGASSITSGTGHAWSEVWDERKREWVRIDATPPGDPNLEDDQTQSKTSPVPGDYGSQEAIRPSDEKVEELRKKLAERKEKLSYTKRERDLSEATGVPLKEAREIVKELIAADQTKTRSGERIVDVLGDVFNAIVRERKNVTPMYDGPVKRNEGGEGITHLIPHVLGLKAGEADPASREKSQDRIITQEIFGGFDLYLVGDKSGSMGNTVEGEALWAMQRRAIYLIFASLYRFAKNIEGSHLPYDNALSVRTQSISFRGDSEEEIDLDKPLSSQFSDNDRVKLWHSLSNQGGGNGDAAALSYIHNQITKEIASTKKGDVHKRLRLVIACSDGGYIGNDAMFMQDIAKQLSDLGVVVVGIGLTETAANVPVVMNTEYSHGDVIRDINELPMVVAKQVIAHAIKLFPPEARVRAEKTIQEVLSKLEHTK